ncbi:hypothetical protein ACFU5O_20995 [Streptomyces sp. NPDC057445]
MTTISVGNGHAPRQCTHAAHPPQLEAAGQVAESIADFLTAL